MLDVMWNKGLFMVECQAQKNINAPDLVDCQENNCDNMAKEQVSDDDENYNNMQYLLL